MLILYMSQEYYRQKYLKYKIKYLDLQEQMGGEGQVNHFFGKILKTKKYTEKREQERAKVEEEKRAKVEEEKRAKVEEEKRAKAEKEKRAKAEKEKRAKVEEEKRAKAEKEKEECTKYKNENGKEQNIYCEKYLNKNTCKDYEENSIYTCTKSYENDPERFHEYECIIKDDCLKKKS